MSLLDKTDSVSVSLTKAYGSQGELCIVVRTNKETNSLRVIYPQYDATVVSELLRHAADMVFNGPPTVKH